MIFGKNCLNKNFVHKNKHLIGINEVDIDRIVISSKNSYGRKGSFKYSIGYINNYIKTLCIKLRQMNGYVKYFNDNKFINLRDYKEYKRKYNAIWDKISNLLKKDLIVKRCMIIKTLKLR